MLNTKNNNAVQQILLGINSLAGL